MDSGISNTRLVVSINPHANEPLQILLNIKCLDWGGWHQTIYSQEAVNGPSLQNPVLISPVSIMKWKFSSPRISCRKNFCERNTWVNHISKDRLLRTRLVTKDGFSTTTYDVRKGICIPPKKEKEMEQSEQGQGPGKGVQCREKSLRSGPGKGLKRVQVSTVNPDGPLCFKRGECVCVCMCTCVCRGRWFTCDKNLYVLIFYENLCFLPIHLWAEILLSSNSGLRWGNRGGTSRHWLWRKKRQLTLGCYSVTSTTNYFTGSGTNNAPFYYTIMSM